MARAALATRVRKLERARGARRDADEKARTLRLEFAFRMAIRLVEHTLDTGGDVAVVNLGDHWNETLQRVEHDPTGKTRLLGSLPTFRDEVLRRIANKPDAAPWDPYGARPLDSYLQDGPPRVGLVRARIDEARAHWEQMVRRSDAACRLLGEEPPGWSMDWDFFYKNCAPEPSPRGDPVRAGVP